MFHSRQVRQVNPVKPWVSYRTIGLRQGRSPHIILIDWMCYACQNYRHDVVGNNVFFECLFRFAQFTPRERIEALNVCRSEHFQSRLTPERRDLVIREIIRYEQHLSVQEAESLIQEQQRQQSRQEEMENDVWRIISLFIHQPVPEPAPSQAAPAYSVQDDEDFGDDIPSSFVCPISFLIMNEPVVASDGITYEKDKIATWMRQNKTSPVSRAVLQPFFFPNLVLKNQIDDWKKAYRKAKAEA
jgi:hypothetical protein